MAVLSFDVLWKGAAAERGMKDLGERTEKTGKSFNALKVAGAAALAAVGVAAVKFGKDSVSAFVEAEQSQIRLQAAFQKFPKLADTNIGALQRLNGQLALKTKYDDDATGSGQAVLAQFGLTGKQITELTPLLQDYASRTGKDLPAAAQVLGKAVLGQGRALRGVGINFKDAGDKGKNFDQIVGGLRKQVGGFAEKEGKSAAGQSAILQNQFGELQEAAGQQLLPALLRTGRGLLRLVGFAQDLGPVFSSFKTIAVETFGTFTDSVGAGRVSFKSFSDFILTHQADIVSGFVTAGKAALGIGKGIATAAAVGLRGFAMIMDSQADMTALSLSSFSNISKGAVLAFGWIPGIGDKLKAADAQIEAFSTGVIGGMRKAADGARGAADGIDNKLNPALDAAGRRLDKVGKQEIIKAAARDAVQKAAVAIDVLGTKSNGSALKLKTFADRSKLSATEQAALRTRLSNASGALSDQLTAMRAAGVGQDKLTAAWKKGRDRLYDEFVQMGLSKKEAQRLAEKYAGIKPKVSTKVEQPGMRKAKEDADALKEKYGDIPKTVTTKLNWDTAVDGINTKLTYKYGRGAKLMSMGGPDEHTPGVSRTPLSVLGRASGGPAASTFGTVHSEGTKAAVSHGTDATAALLKQLAPSLGLGAGAPGGQVGVTSRGMAATIAAMRARGARSFTTYPGHHPSPDKARDVTPHNWDIANAARASSSVWYVIYRMMIASKNHGNAWRPYRPTNFRGDWQHVRHVHVGWYDRGGVTRDLHAGGRPERVLSPVQTRAFEHMVRIMDRGGGIRNTTIVYQFPNYVGDKADLKRALVDMSRRGDLKVILG